MSTYRRKRSIKLKDVVKTTESGKIPLPLPSARFYVLVPAIAVMDPIALRMQEYQMNANRGYTPQAFNINMNQTYTFNTQQQENPNIIEDDYNRTVLVNWDLGLMLDAYQNGYRIGFTNHKESYRLYTVIEEYFDLIDQIRQNGYESYYEFDPRLALLDDFNKNIFNNNSSFIKNERGAIITNARKRLLSAMGLDDKLVLDNRDSGVKYTPVKNTDNDKPMSPSEFRRRRKGPSTINATPDPQGRSMFQPEFYDAPTVDFSKIKHVPRYVDPEERRISKEHLRAKKQLEGQ